MKGNKKLLTVLNSLLADELTAEWLNGQMGMENYLVSQTESPVS